MVFFFFFQRLQARLGPPFSSNSFKLAFQHVTFIGNWSFWDGFWTFSKLFLARRFNEWIPLVVSILFHITHGHIPPWISCVLGVAYFLTISKLSSGVCFITMGETLYWFISRILCLQFHNAFVTNFSLHQFRIVIKGNCEIVIHDVKCTLDLHLD